MAETTVIPRGRAIASASSQPAFLMQDLLPKVRSNRDLRLYIDVARIADEMDVSRA